MQTKEQYKFRGVPMKHKPGERIEKMKEKMRKQTAKKVVKTTHKVLKKVAKVKGLA